MKRDTQALLAVALLGALLMALASRAQYRAHQRQLELDRAAWCLHDWQDLASTECPMAE